MAELNAAFRKKVEAALSAIIDPVSGKDLVSAGLVADIKADDNGLRIILEINPVHHEQMMPVREATENALQQIDGVKSASAVLTAHKAKAATDQHNVATGRPSKIAGVKYVIVFASGKGGVGKSTVSANIAVLLAREGKKVGLLDADIHGPSQPTLFGVADRKATLVDKKIEPIEAHAVRLMSIGLMAPRDQAISWRGPVLQRAVNQMLAQVSWGDLDVLLIDLPPGTGDVQIGLCQHFAIDGAIIISTPQDVAMQEARRAMNMFQKMGIPIKGIIENMSYYRCAKCGAESHIFGHGGAHEEAEVAGIPYLGALPLDIDVRISGDSGKPIAGAEEQTASTIAYNSIAKKIADLLVS